MGEPLNVELRNWPRDTRYPLSYG